MGRFDKFASGLWQELIVESNNCTEEAATVMRHRRRRDAQNQTERRAPRALQFVQMGELSSGRQALEGAELADRNEHILAQWRKRLARRIDPIPDAPPHLPVFNLDENIFIRNVRSASDHLRPLLDSSKHTYLLFLVGELLAKGRIPNPVRQFLRLGRMTALRKKEGRVRGIVAGEVIRRLTAKTIAQQLGPAVTKATAPCQCALSTRAGCECVAHPHRNHHHVD